MYNNFSLSVHATQNGIEQKPFISILFIDFLSIGSYHQNQYLLKLPIF